MMRIVSAVAVLIAAGLLGWFVVATSGNPAHFGTKLGLDLAGGTELIYKADTSAVGADKQGALNGLRDVLERRVNLFGVAEPIVELEHASAVSGTQEDRVLIDLPGVTDVKAAVDAIGKTPTLDFRLEATGKNSATGSTTNTTGIFLPTGLSGRYLQKAELQFGTGNSAVANKPTVVIHFDDAGAKLFAEITSKNVGKRLGIYLDGQPISTPVIDEAIPGGTATITGSFTPKEAKDLVENLNFGALPVPISLLSSNSVGPTLGGQAFHDGIKAGAVGFMLVALFMIIWYRLPGLVATAALVIYMLITIAVIKVVPITLTASGIAGFILSIGMAVDANVLIFERMKEEIRSGKGAREAVHIGFGRAWPAIRDGHLTMLISAVILFWLGTSLVQGFALVFGFGVIASLISAVAVSRVFLLAIVPVETKGIWRFLLEAGFGHRAPKSVDTSKK